MKHQNFFIVLVFLVFILAASGALFGQRVINLDKVWGDMRVHGDDFDDQSGYAVASGDINGDGYMDIIIGAWAADPPGGGRAGETYVVFGSNNPPSTLDLSTESADITIYGDDYLDQSGIAVGSGDVNGDNYDDIIIGASVAYPPGGADAGETYVIFGGSFLSPPYTIDLNSQSADITIYGDDVNDYSGFAVANGDVNNDGYHDLIIGATHGDLPGRSGIGETYVILGSFFPAPPYIIDLNLHSAAITIYGDDADDCSGCAVASGDVNNDNYDDIIIGTPGADPPGGGRAGETYVIFGGSFPWPPYTIDLDTQSADITICGDDAEDISGRAVTSGDMNGDGFDDIIIGSPDADPYGRIYAGETYVIFGSSFPSPPYTIDLNSQSADITICGDDAGDYCGWAVASGDVNGDGFDDLIIGAKAAAPGEGD